MDAAGLVAETTIANSTTETMMTAGLSRRKAEYLIGLAMEITSGALDLAELGQLPGDEVQARLTDLGYWGMDGRQLSPFCACRHGCLADQ